MYSSLSNHENFSPRRMLWHTPVRFAPAPPDTPTPLSAGVVAAFLEVLPQSVAEIADQLMGEVGPRMISWTTFATTNNSDPGVSHGARKRDIARNAVRRDGLTVL